MDAKQDQQGNDENRTVPEYHFTPKFQHHVKLHLMSGVTLLPWLRVLRIHWQDIHWRLYWHRVLFLTFMACVNTLLAIPDWWRFSRRIAGQQLHAEPLFILGNPRTGTTHLHNLLSLDPHFTYANTFQAGFPSSFITLEQVGARPVLQPLLAPTRPMDAMRLTWDTPAEDEIAVQALSGGVSFYHPLVFPKKEKSIRCLLTLRGATPEQYAAWQDALLWMFRKVTFRDVWLREKAQNARNRRSHPAGSQHGLPTPAQQQQQQQHAHVSPLPLLIKSPVHTARLRVWRALFPQARYVYIHRNPYEVFRSSAHMVDTYFWYCYLQRPTDRGLTDYILDQYVTMHEAYVTQRQHVAADRLFEVRFEDLDAKPLEVLRQLYNHFGWGERYEALVPVFMQYLSSLSDFKKNQLNTLTPELTAHINRVWAPSFQEFGYKMEGAQ